ncbi:MAG TPA: T9SS type A sorting domain-containing protein [Saprospiraceae bacterium]|nr:T9SS type A sorting domain-containing protein [Saprospiraceae bacterium]HMQ81474.1 T9SS type A sorting domain-containing protein [Saprospiraceae bacterium]
MKPTVLFTTFFYFSLLLIGHAQSTALRVYDILQDKCATCHSHANPQNGLDLEGGGSTTEEKAADVYNNVFNVTPANAAAAAKGDKYIYPGRADKSFLFRKINDGLEATLGLSPAEMQSMPPYGQPQLNDVEKEIIRQWILHGADADGELVNEAKLDTYYNTSNYQKSFPDGPPEAPAASEGFQIKMGPFYIEPGGEIEYFSKYELKLPADVEVNRLEVSMGNYSHHFLIYDFENGGDQSIDPGFRLEPDHTNIGLVAAVQESTDLRLPEGTAFKWDNNLVLDLNSHYINYSAQNIYQAEVYVNVYTQPIGTAAQEMYTELIVKDDIYIPNTGLPITQTQHFYDDLGEIYLWGVMGHTHKYGTGYKVFKRLPGGVKGEMIYDASCPMGIPGCVSPFFDYQHIPMRYFEPLQPLAITPLYGIIHEANWINDGPTPLWFGPTSDDEMMVLVVMFTTSLEGVVKDTDIAANPAYLAVYPNPTAEFATISLPTPGDIYTLQIMDAMGSVKKNIIGVSGENYTLQTDDLPTGMYYFMLKNTTSNRYYTGKFVKSQQ